MSTIAVTGGTGFVGGHLLRVAVDAGHRVRALTRRDQPPCPGIDWISGTLSEPENLELLTRGADSVIHIAGAIRAPDRDGFAAPNIAGTANVIDAARQAGVRRFIHISSLAAREPDLSDYGWSKAESERVVQESALDWTIIRPPAVYGPGDGETLDLFAMAAKGVVILPPEGRTSLIHVRDLCALMLATVEAEPAIGAIYEPDDGTPGGLSHVAFGQALGRAVGRDVRTLSMPAPLVRFGARMDGLFRGENAKLTPDRARYFCHPDWVVDPDRKPPATLWIPAIPHDRGLADTARWYREQDWLK
ncbi:NAD(P)H-binding protein [Parasphingopyxis algicola]|uniref:NAD-dependent epimerase/dehydratase family protein n=1 Tax=Parasphingopyxis algicola TaxID=2026624 RepID=UPI0015A38F0B|nr:NAD-dependent epimerase/dehydratase family protein [Parasphingopyxis algicola]QLC26333.1 NAD(P)H-binding protein [Parasphingopyxis algicola]